MRTKIILFLVLIVLGGTSMWYINYPAHEKRAEDRIHKYLNAQGVDKNKVSNKVSSKDKKTGRWTIVYKFEDEKNLAYEYIYDKDEDEVLLIVYDTPDMDGGQSIETGMNYPQLEDDWVKFDSKGNLQLSHS